MTPDHIITLAASGESETLEFKATTGTRREATIAPDAVGKLIASGLQIPFYLEYELRARHPRGVAARLWELDSPRLALAELTAYRWDALYHRMRPVGQ